MDSVLTFWIVAVWGVAVLMSWVGWGTLMGMGVSKEERFDWGLRAAWGMAGTLAVGGVLVAVHLATVVVLQALVLGGVAVWGLIVFGVKRRRVEGGVEWRWKVPVLLLVVVAYLGSVGATSSVDLNWSDDLPIYLPLVKRMVQTGGLEEPFSLRRMSSYGGQLFLQGEVMAVGSESNAMVVDKGLALVVVLGLVWGMFLRAGRWRGWIVLGVGLLVVLVDVPRVNTQSQVTGVVLFLGLMRTLMLGGRMNGHERHERHEKREFLLGAVVAGIVGAG